MSKEGALSAAKGANRMFLGRTLDRFGHGHGNYFQGK